MSNNNVVTLPKQATAIQTNFAPTNFQELLKFSDLVSKSSFVPKDYVSKPANVMIAVQMGAELGLAPMQSLQNIAVINGKPSIYGDAMLAIRKASPLCEWIKEEIQGDTKEKWVAICTVKRKGNPEVIRKFSWQDAVDAQLIAKANKPIKDPKKPNDSGYVNKSAPWNAYPKRMLQMRARGFALRDAFPDLLNGLISQEEAQDYPTKENEPAIRLESRAVSPQQQTIDSMPDAEIAQDPQKSELEIQYERLSHALVDVESRTKLEKITGHPATIKLRDELEKKEPIWAGIINDLVNQALDTFNQQEEQENAV